MAEIDTLATLEGYAKEVYGELQNLIPDFAKLLQSVPFRQAEKLGFAYNCDVILADEQGVTYGGPEEDGILLNPPTAMSTRNARVKGAQIAIRAQIGYKLAASAAAAGQAAFGNATQLIMKRLLASESKRVEIMHLYGGSGLGVVNDSANVDTTHTTMQFTTPSFAAGIWVGMKGAAIEVWDDTNDVQVGSTFVVVKVDIAARTLEVSGSTSDISDLDVFLAAAPPDGTVYFQGARGKESLGLDQIIVTDGDLFEIDNDEFDLFKGQRFDVGNAALTFDKLSSAVVSLINYGADGNMLVWINPLTWESLNQDEAALRQYDYSYKPAKGEKGNEALVYHVQGRMLEIVAHPMIKEGEGFIVQKDSLKRVGACDITTMNPGMGDRMFRELANHTAFEVRAYTDQALFTDEPSHLLKLYNISNINNP